MWHRSPSPATANRIARYCAVRTLDAVLPRPTGAVTDRIHHPETNLRELGGYRTLDGRRIREGLLFRSGRMNELDEDATAVYRGLGLRTIIDLRREDEVEAAPTPRFGAEVNTHISVSSGDTTFAVAAANITEPGAARMVLDQAGSYYDGLVRDRLHHFVPVFDLLFDADRLPTLFHCTAGKDRTGFVAAAILKFLDVDDATVMADYMLSSKVRATWVDTRIEERRAAMARDQGVAPHEVDPEPLEALRTLMSTDASMLQATFDAVADTYGTWHELRRAGLGISDARLETFKQAVLEP